MTPRDVRDGLADMQAQCQGVWHIDVHPADQFMVARLLADVTLMRAMVAFTDAMDTATAANPRLCLTCHNAFSAATNDFPAALVVMQPHLPVPTGAVVQAVCHDCYAIKPAVLRQTIVRAVSRYTGYDMRTLDTAQAAGRA